MPTVVPKEPVVAALGEVWGRLDELLGGLDDNEWETPTCLPGWDVKAVVAHVIGTESMLLGDSAPAVEVDREARDHVRNDIGRFNEAWVVAVADEKPADVLTRFRDRIALRLDALDGDRPGAVGHRRVHTGRAGHLRAVHAHPRVRLLAARTGHPRRRRSVRR